VTYAKTTMVQRDTLAGCTTGGSLQKSDEQAAKKAA